MRLLVALLALAGLIGGLMLWRGGETAVTPAASLIPLLADENTAEFARATVPDAIQFPRDLGAHDAYQTEWWYTTGNLETADGRAFGYQFTIFRRALNSTEAIDCADLGSSGAEEPGGNTISPAPHLPCPPASTWRTNQIYLAHFALSDIENGDFYAHERFSRGGAGLAGAQAAPYRVWLEDWQVAEVDEGVVRVTAVAGDIALDLTLTQTLPPVRHGDGGLSPKGPQPGNASYYYSIVHQQTEGTVWVNGRGYPITGESWKDHEYSTSALSGDAVGWDWFSLQLDDGSALMFFQIRRGDGTLEPFSSGSFIAADGTVTPLSLADWRLDVTDAWRSPTSGGDYPAGWRIEVPGLALELEGKPLMPNQELNVSTVYWEGATAFTGTRAGQPITAKGYVELTGYAQTMRGQL